MGKASRGKKQAYRKVKVSMGEMEKFIENKLREAYPEEAANAHWLKEGVSAALADEVGELHRCSFASHLLVAAEAWADSRRIGDCEAMTIVASPGAPTEEKRDASKSGVAAYIWGDSHGEWHPLANTSPSAAQILQDALTTRYKTSPGEEPMAPGTLVLSIGTISSNGVFHGEVNYGWEITALGTTPAAIAHGPDGGTTLPAPIDLISYFIEEYLPAYGVLPGEDAGLDPVRYTAAIMDQFIDGCAEGKKYKLSIAATTDEVEGLNHHTVAMWQREGDAVSMIDSLDGDVDPFFIAGMTYRGFWDTAGLTLNVSNEDGTCVVMGWHITPGNVDALGAQEICDAYNMNSATGEILDPVPGMEYSDAFPLDLSFHDYIEK